MYLLRKARSIFRHESHHLLSPSFEDAEFIDRGQELVPADILSHINHSLGKGMLCGEGTLLSDREGRIHYTMGDIKVAVEFLMSLFQSNNTDVLQDMVDDHSARLYIEDFRAAFQVNDARVIYVNYSHASALHVNFITESRTSRIHVSSLLLAG